MIPVHPPCVTPVGVVGGLREYHMVIIIGQLSFMMGRAPWDGGTVSPRVLIPTLGWREPLNGHPQNGETPFVNRRRPHKAHNTSMIVVPTFGGLLKCLTQSQHGVRQLTYDLHLAGERIVLLPGQHEHVLRIHRLDISANCVLAVPVVYFALIFGSLTANTLRLE